MAFRNRPHRLHRLLRRIASLAAFAAPAMLPAQDAITPLGQSLDEIARSAGFVPEPFVTPVTIGLVAAVALAFGCIGAVLARAFSSGAEAYSGAYSERTAREFAEIYLFIPPRRIAEMGWAAAAAVLLAVFLASGGVEGSLSSILVRIALSLVPAAAMLAVPGLILSRLRVRRREKFNRQLIDALVSMGNALKSGFSITQAIEHVVENGENPIAQEFDTFLHQTRVGVSFTDALNNLDQRVGSDDLSLVVLSIETARRTGGNLTEIFENISRTIRERFRIENRIKTLTAQGRLQGIIIGLMPIAIGAFLFFFQPAMFRPFIQSTTGIIVIAIGFVLLLCGMLSIRKIVNIDV